MLYRCVKDNKSKKKNNSELGSGKIIGLFFLSFKLLIYKGREDDLI